MFTLLSILVLTVLVVVHEWGHFIAAKLQGIRVQNFSIGFGPTLFRHIGPETEYTLRAIPLGGFVSFPDDDSDPDPNLFANRPALDRAIVLSAGVFANFVFAFLLLLVMTMTVGTGLEEQPGVKVVQINQPNSPAAIAGLKPGDIILQAGTTKLGNDLEVLTQFQKYVAESPDRSIPLQVLRQAKTLELTVTTQGTPPKIGVLLDYTGQPHRQAVRNPISAIKIAARKFERLVSQTIGGLVSLVTDFGAVASHMAGPVAIVAMGSEIARSDGAGLFDFTAIISINLAIINLLPLPALDGGQLLFLLLEKLRGGKPLPKNIQETVMQGGLVMLLGLGVLMIVKDSYQLFQGLLTDKY